MKRALINIAIMSNLLITTQTYAEDATNTDHTSDAATDSYLYYGIGAGAAAGTLIAGPVGLVIGAGVGALLADNQTIDSTSDKTIDDTIDNTDVKLSDDTLANQSSTSTDKDTSTVVITDNHQKNEEPSPDTIQLAQSGDLTPLLDVDTTSGQDNLLDILINDLSLDIYFRSGSSDIEPFYPARLEAIARLVNSIDELELQLEGFTDRRGDKDKNIELADARIDQVRTQLIDAGVSADRIISKAYGETNMQSTPGNLEAYTFDRRVVISFQRVNPLSPVTSTAQSHPPHDTTRHIEDGKDVTTETSVTAASELASTMSENAHVTTETDTSTDSATAF